MQPEGMYVGSSGSSQVTGRKANSIFAKKRNGCIVGDAEAWHCKALKNNQHVLLGASTLQHSTAQHSAAQHSRRQARTKVGDPAKEALRGSHSRGADHLRTTQANQHLGAIQEEAHGGHRQPLGRGLIGACPEGCQGCCCPQGICNHHLSIT